MSSFLQKTIQVKAPKRGFHLITEQIVKGFPEISKVHVGILHIFIQHTSASLTINENWDPTVRTDMANHIDKMIPENAPYYEHNYEGPDDMPAHIKSTVIGSSLTLPVYSGKLNLGTWQGIYLCEHRNVPTARNIVLTLQR